MKGAIIVCLVLLLAGCASVPSEFAEKMSATAHEYGRITTTMTKEEVLARLGAPQREEEGKLVWEIQYNALNYNALHVEFTSLGKVKLLTTSYSRGSCSMFGDARLKTEVTK